MQTDSVVVPLIAFVLLIGAIVVLVLIIWSIKRHRAPRLAVECDAPLAELMPTIAGLTHGGIVEGNAVELLEDGAFFDALFEEIKGARKTVHFETFLWQKGELGQRVADALCERARAGLEVRVLLDATGTKKMGTDVERQLTAARCKLVKYHPRRLRHIGVLNHRDHRKILVADGKVALTGGHCITDEWLKDCGDRKQVRDIGVRLRGPVVHEVQAVFSENWIEETGELIAGEDVFPVLEPAGNVPAHVAHVQPEGSAPAVKILHHFVICVARERIWIQNPYFLPEPEAIDAFGEAVKRGVDVRIMVPTAEASDMPMVQHAAHRNFEKLLECGVRMFEYPKALLHQKVLTIDGVWCAVGTTNFDDRAFEINDEITVGFNDAGLARALEEIFERDMKDCVELDLERWKKRGAFHRLKDHFYYLFNEQL